MHFFFSSAFGDEELHDTLIEWKPVDVAEAYYLELKTFSGETIFQEKIPKSRIRIKLKHGKYKFRVAIVNKFGKKGGWSKWFELEVFRALLPQLDSVDPPKIFAEDKKETLTIRGKNFYKSTQVFLKKEENEIPVENIKFIDENTISFDIDKTGITPGSYDIIILNPGDQKTAGSNLLTVSIKMQPGVTSITPNSVYNEKKKDLITVNGENFQEGATIKLYNDEGALSIDNIKIPDANTISFSLDKSGASPGSYSIKVENPGGLNVTRKDIFVIKAFQRILDIHSLFGIETGYSMPPLNVESGYSGAIGLSFFYEDHALARHSRLSPYVKGLPELFLGARLSYYYFISPKPNFGTSTMYQVSLYGGYDFTLPFLKFVPWTLSPYAGYKHYYRKHEYYNQEYTFYRPILLLGSNVNFYPYDRFLLGFGLEYNMVFEEILVHTVTAFFRFGYAL